MPTPEKIDKILLAKVGGGGVRMVALLLDLSQSSTVPTWIQGRDALGRGIVLLGDEAMGDGPEAREAVELVLADLAAGGCPDPVLPIAVAPIASTAVIAAVDGPETEILLHGERGSGKTVLEMVTALILAKRHTQAGCPAPLRALWVHDTLLAASLKTARSMEAAMWAGGWSVFDDRRAAKFTLAGRTVLLVDFVGASDEQAVQRLRVSADLVIVDDVVPSLSDHALGISESQYELALSSMQRQDVVTPRKVAICSTNPGAPRHWSYRRFLSDQRRPSTKAIHIPGSDRLSLSERQALAQSFASNPTLQARLARGEWLALPQGCAVAEGFAESAHVAKHPLRPDPSLLLGIGVDGGHSPSMVVGQIHEGQIRVYASFNLLKAGLLELVQQELRPWVQSACPWALDNRGASIVWCIDPSLKTPTQVSYADTPEKMLLEQIGGRAVPGPVRWPGRREAVLKALAPSPIHGRARLQIAHGTDTGLLIEALSGGWYYPIGPDGEPDRSGAKKPNSPASDVGDAFAYLCAWLLSGELMHSTPLDRPLKVETQFSLDRPGDQSFDVGQSIFR